MSGLGCDHWRTRHARTNGCIRLLPPDSVTQGDNHQRVVFGVLGAPIMSFSCQSKVSPPPACVHGECGGHTLLDALMNAIFSVLWTCSFGFFGCTSG